MTHEGEPRIPFPEVPETVGQWALELMEAVPPTCNSDAAGVFGYGVQSDNLDAVTVLVGTGTDLSDKERFPDEVDGTRIVYSPLSPPELY